MKKYVLFILLGVGIGFYAFSPELSKEEIAFHTKTNNTNAKAAKFLIGTKVGRKISYIFIKKSTKKKIKQLKKETDNYLKNLGLD